MTDRELIIDSFAGGGGASLGIAEALGRPVDIAINHDAGAIGMHAANHPETRHYTEDVWKVSPRQVTGGRPVGLLWASPDCKHFSRAKGGKPVEKRIRSLAWIVVKWAVESRPRLIILENVREFAEWGPLVPRWRCSSCQWQGTDGQTRIARKRRSCPRCESHALRETAELVPDPSRKGLTFKRWAGRLRNLGYAVEWKVLDAADYGAPTHRRRLFIIARCDEAPIVWPEPTHGDPRKIVEPELFGRQLAPWRTAAECIDWSLPCPSIFMTREEARIWAKAHGCAAPQRPLKEKTLRRIALGVKRYVLDNPRPFIVTCNHGGPEFRGQDLGDPLPTLAASRDAHGLVMPCLVRYNSEKSDGDTRSQELNRPLGTIVTENRFGIVATFLDRIGQAGGNGKYTNDPREPVTTITTKAEHLLIAPTLVQTGYGGQVEAPLPTTTCRGTQTQVVAANLVHFNHGDKQWSAPTDPMRTVTTGNHAFLVYSFLVKYFGTAIGQAIDVPLHTATGKARFGLVTVTVDGEPYVIEDIGMRMLKPRDLARGQGFPESYRLTGTVTHQVNRIGNSVPPVLARVLVEANYAPALAEV